MRAFTYWEGDLPYANWLCLRSVAAVYGHDHVHLSPENVNQFVSVPSWIESHPSIAWRSDFIRGQLLQQHGGVWFDCDILLNRRIEEDIQPGQPRVWREGGYPINDDGRYGNLPELCIGVIYSPKGHAWLSEVLLRFEREAIGHRELGGLLPWVAGQRIYRDVIYDSGEVDVGDERRFNLVADAREWFRYWDGSVAYSPGPLGIHLLLGAHRNGYRYSDPSIGLLPGRIRRLGSAEGLLEAYPTSVLAGYLARNQGT